MAKNFRLLEAKMSPEARARAQAKADELIREMALDELREALRLTQESLAEAMHIKQAAVSKVERRSDMFISTLRKIIQAMGGELEIRAVFPSGAVRINQFRDVRKRRSHREKVQAAAG
jgi:transcriptional regulator with XRE-family HTH domain